MKHVLISGFLLVLFAISPHSNAADNSVQPGSMDDATVLLIRHALAPGTGDPSNFQVDDCATQRNLSDEGRAQARRIGALIGKSVSRDVKIFSSQWCRCLETARLLDLGSVREQPFLNSFYQRSQNRDAQTADLRAWIKNADPTPLHILVTHQVNITALTGVYPRSGEIIAVRSTKPGDIEVVGRIETD